jgi:DNA-binding NarL/FixJ family response regulator
VVQHEVEMSLPLSPRQRDVMRELLAGLCIEGVAARVGIAVGTARFHRHEVYTRLGVNSQTALMAKYMRITPEAQRVIDGDA